MCVSVHVHGIPKFAKGEVIFLKEFRTGENKLLRTGYKMPTYVQGQKEFFKKNREKRK